VISTTFRTGFIGLALLTTCSLLGGCASRSALSESEELAGAGDDDAITQSNLESMGTSFVGSSSGGNLGVTSPEELNSLARQPGELTAQSGGSNPPGGFYQPAGCLTVNADIATRTITYAFSDCTGPYGLVHLTGTVDVVWSSSGSTNLQLAFSAQDFQINSATVTTWNATAVITANGDARDMTWAASLSGTTGHGRAFNRTNNKDIKWTVGTPCLAISGSSQGDVTGLNLLTTITNYQRCVDSCPQAGSEINVKDVTDGKSIDLTYLGGQSAQFTGVEGKVWDLTVACGL
jgi:hypothetical protein